MITSLPIFCQTKCKDCLPGKKRKCNIRWGLIYIVIAVSGIVVSHFGYGIQIPLPSGCNNPAGIPIIKETPTGDINWDIIQGV
jgi:hypothetical protein